MAEPGVVLHTQVFVVGITCRPSLPLLLCSLPVGDIPSTVKDMNLGALAHGTFSFWILDSATAVLPPAGEMKRQDTMRPVVQSLVLGYNEPENRHPSMYSNRFL